VTSRTLTLSARPTRHTRLTISHTASRSRRRDSGLKPMPLHRQQQLPPRRLRRLPSRLADARLQRAAGAGVQASCSCTRMARSG
jgi:hypothetical protein